MSKRTELFIEFNKGINGNETFFGQVLFGLMAAGKYSISNPIKKKPQMKKGASHLVDAEMIETKGLFLTNAGQYITDPTSPDVLLEYRELIAEQSKEMIKGILVAANSYDDTSKEEMESTFAAFQDVIGETDKVLFGPAKTTVKFNLNEFEIDEEDISSIQSAVAVMSKEIEGLELRQVFMEVVETKNVVLFSK